MDSHVGNWESWGIFKTLEKDLGDQFLNPNWPSLNWWKCFGE